MRCAVPTIDGHSSWSGGSIIGCFQPRISRCGIRSLLSKMRRVAAAGARTAFVAAMPIEGKSFGHPDFDPVWAAAEELDLAVGLHLVSHRHYTGSAFYHEPKPGLMYFSMNLIQDPRQALTTMVVDGVFERFPRLRVGTIEAMVGWVGEWLERVDYRYRYMAHTSQI